MQNSSRPFGEMTPLYGGKALSIGTNNTPQKTTIAF
jgi:hypothetical protein